MAIVTCGPACTHEDKIGYTGCGDPVQSYVGAVLELDERNGYDDSDFLAIVWDEESGTVKVVEYGTTRFWTYHNGATVDATEEAQAKALAWYRAYYERVAIQDAEHYRTIPAVDTEVRSLTTRGRNVGIVGVVKWYGPDRYRRVTENYQPMRVGIKIEGESKYRFLPAESVEVISPAPVDTAAIAERAASAVPANWKSAVWLGVGSVLARRAA